MNDKGFALLFNIFLIGLLMAIGGALTKSIYNAASSAYLEKDYLKAFYLAEAALEFGKTEIKKNPAWYTDLSSSGNLTKWLKERARGQKVYTLNCKIVKISGQDAIYGVGYSNQSCAIIKFDGGYWEEL